MRSPHKVQQDLTILTKMLGLFCQAKHPSQTQELCTDCAKLLKYAQKRLTYCRFGDNKPMCARCPIHCYHKDYRTQIRVVMRYSGPRMIVHYPRLCLQHYMGDLWAKIWKQKHKTLTIRG
jgi:hypothetical protein